MSSDSICHADVEPFAGRHKGTAIYPATKVAGLCLLSAMLFLKDHADAMLGCSLNTSVCWKHKLQRQLLDICIARAHSCT